MIISMFLLNAVFLLFFSLFFFFFHTQKMKMKIKINKRNELSFLSMFKWRKMFNKIEWKLFLSMFFSLFWNQLSIRFFFLSFSIFEATFFLINFIRNKIGGLDSNEQTILTNFYNSLISKGNLNWNIGNDLCGQTGVYCDPSTPKRVTILYSYFSFFFYHKQNLA